MREFVNTGMILDIFRYEIGAGLVGKKKDEDKIPVQVPVVPVTEPVTVVTPETTKTVEAASYPYYSYTPGQFGYGPFTYEDFTYKDQALYDAARDKVSNFSYDPEGDNTYQAYARQYKTSGQDAYRNAMARLASRTGGVASSYAVQAAQGAYNDYLQELANKVPELSQLAYQRARDQYNLYNNEYDRDLSKYQADRNLAYNQYQDAMEMAYKNFALQESARQAAYNRNYEKKLSDYENLLSGGKYATASDALLYMKDFRKNHSYNDSLLELADMLKEGIISSETYDNVLGQIKKADSAVANSLKKIDRDRNYTK